MNEFFARLAQRWRDGAAERGVEIASPELDPTVAEELLELARVVAHTKERRFAPLATFTAGVATERFCVAKGTADPQTLTAYVREIREALEREGAEP